MSFYVSLANVPNRKITWYNVMYCSAFLLQMVILYKDPEGKKIFENDSEPHLKPTVTMSDTELEKHCQDLEKRLRQYEVSLHNTIRLRIVASFPGHSPMLKACV